jgi:putative MATE family efflux protein
VFRNEDKSTERLATAPIGRLLFEYAVPCVVAELVYSLYSIIDSAILGWFVGDYGLAVITLSIPIQNMMMALGLLIGMGGNALAAIQLGKGKIDKVELTLGNSFVLMIIMSIIVAILGWIFIDPLLTLIGTTQELWEPTKQFVLILITFDIFVTIGFGLYNFLRTAGRPDLALASSAFSAVMCVVFNLLFVAVMNMGVAGSALATVCGEATTAIPVIWYFTKCKTTPFKLRVKCFKLDFGDCMMILKLGLASFAMQVGSTVVNIVFNHVIAIYGSTSTVGVEGCLAGIGVSNRVVWIICSVFIGITMGMQPIVGYNIGARKWQRVLDALKTTCLSGIVTGFIVLALIHIFPDQILFLFGISGELEEFSKWSLFVNMFFCPLVAFQIIGGSYFQSSGQPYKAAFIELLRQVILLTPFYIIFPMLAGVFKTSPVNMILFSVPSADILSVAVTSIFVILEVKKLKKWIVSSTSESL